MSSDDDELLSYTPLKRQKIGSSASIHSSQISYSQVQERHRNKLRLSSQTPRSHNQSQSSKLTLRTQISNISNLPPTNKSNVTVTSSKFKKPLTSSKEAKNVLNSSISSKANRNSSISILKSNSPKSLSNINNKNKSKDGRKLNSNSKNKSQGTRKLNNSLENELKETTKLKSNYKNESENAANLNHNYKVTKVTDIFADDTPDIDLTQVIHSASDCDEVMEEVLSDNPNENESNVKAHTHNRSQKNQNDDSIFNFINHVDDSSDDADFFNIEEPVQRDLTEVKSWVDSCLQQGFITPKKVEYVNDIPSENSQSRSNNAKPSQEDIANSKTCIHLHFHVNSPKKFIQPTIDHYFKKSSCNLTPKEGGSQEVRNEEDVQKAWRNIMNSKKSGPTPGPSNAKQIGNERADTESEPDWSSVSNKKCPFYKFVEDTSFVVDGFSYGHLNGVTAYFLSHFHYDHYRGLTKKFQKPIYCTQITANLVRLKLSVEARYLRPLPLEEPRIIDGVEVTLYDSNHCPGAVMFLFKLTTGKVLLHVGDFRAHPNMETINALWNNSISVLYLDTTYLDPTYDFLSQEDILEKCKAIATEHSDFNKQTLFLVGSYTIGKEKVFKAIASELDCKIYAPPYKERILRCLEDKEITDRLTRNKYEARVHVVSMGEITPWKLKQYMEALSNSFKVCVAIKPTGWEHNASIDETLESLKPKHIGNIYIYGVPYSEHSSFFELKRFVQFVQAKKIIPTVNVGRAEARNKMMRILKKWQDESRTTFRKN